MSSFILHFSDDISWAASFPMLIFNLYIFYDEVSVKVFGSFFDQIVFLLLSFKSTLCVLG